MKKLSREVTKFNVHYRIQIEILGVKDVYM